MIVKRKIYHKTESNRLKYYVLYNMLFTFEMTFEENLINEINLTDALVHCLFVYSASMCRHFKIYNPPFQILLSAFVANATFLENSIFIGLGAIQSRFKALMHSIMSFTSLLNL